jgi:hypothetical protein
MQSVFMLKLSNKAFMLSVIMINVIILIVVGGAKSFCSCTFLPT